MHIISQKVNVLISGVVAFLSTIFGEFWFLFAFLLVLNVLDYTTGIIKAKYLRIESSKKAFKGCVKTLLTWVVVFIAFGISYCIIEIGHQHGKNLVFISAIGWFALAHAIINEIRSILENIVEMDKGELIPSWLIRGLEVTQRIVEKNANKIIENIEKKEKGEENEDREDTSKQK